MKKVREHLLRLRAPEVSDEQDALWAATADFDPPSDKAETNADMPLPHPVAIIVTGLHILTPLMCGGIYKRLRLF